MLSPADAEMIAVRYGFETTARMTGPVDRGYQGVIWRLEVDGGARSYAVKETLAPLSRAQAELALDCQRRSAQSGAATPAQLLTADGDSMIITDDAVLRVFDWVEMAGPDRGLEPELVGVLLAQLHLSGRSTDEPLHPWYVEPVGDDRWRELLEQCRRAGAPFADPVAELLPGLVEMESWLTAPDGPYVMGHRDLWADNVRAWTGEGLLIIDWDNCGPVVPGQELGMLLVEFGTTPDRARRLVQAYRGAGGPGRVATPADLTMPIAVLDHLLELGMRQWLDADDDDERARAEGRVREFVEDPLTPESMRQLLARLR